MWSQVSIRVDSVAVRVIVIGAGVAGAAAVSFARRGEEVIGVEGLRSAHGFVPGRDPEEGFREWGRPGIAQFRQPQLSLRVALLLPSARRVERCGSR